MLHGAARGLVATFVVMFIAAVLMPAVTASYEKVKKLIMRVRFGDSYRYVTPINFVGKWVAC